MTQDRRWNQQLGYESLQEALGALAVDDLKQRGRLFAARVPGRKADLIKHLVGQLAGEKLHRFYEELDEVRQKAVAEAAHAPGFKLDAEKFRAKYGKVPILVHGFRDAESRFGRIEDGSPARLYACDNRALASLIANDTRLRKLCPSCGRTLSCGSGRQ